MSPTRLIMFIFFIQPIVFGNWLARIPVVQEALGLSPSEMSIAFLGLPIGILLSLPMGSRIANRLGARRLLQVGFVVFLAVIQLPGLANSLPLLFVALVIVGSVLSVLELAMNVLAAEIETASGRLIMSTSHGFWSVGIAFGSFLGSGLAALKLSLPVSMALVAVVVLPLALWSSRLLPASSTHTEEAPKEATIFALPSPVLFGICCFVFGVAMTEGAMADWSGIFLRDVVSADASITGLGYGIFASMVAAGRFLGDFLKGRFGAVKLAATCGVMAITGIALLGVSQSVTMTLLCYALIGFGVSVGFPLSVSAASALKDRPAATNVAVLSIMSMLGFLIGPPMIGFAAEAAGMRYGLLSLLVPLAISLVAARFLRPAS